MKIFKNCIPMLPLALLCACSMAPDYQDPKKDAELEKAVGENFYHAPDLWTSAKPADTENKGNWWSIFNDAVLSNYMEELAAHNPDLKSAFYTVEQARAAAAMTEAELYPWLNGDAEYSRTGLSDNTFGSSGATYNKWLIGASLTWDPDFFGRVRNLMNSDMAKAQSLLAAYKDTMLKLQSELAIAYFSLKQYNSEKILLKETIDVRQEQVKLVNERFKSGTSILVDLRRAEQQLYEAKAQYSAILKSADLTKDYIALLLGKTRTQINIGDTVLSDSLPKAPKCVPSQVLQRRYDIASAERLVYAANERIGAANAAFFPTVTISASADYAAADIDKLFDASSLAWGVGPRIYLPLFQAGKLYAQRKTALYEHKQILESYRATVLRAMKEVEDSLTSIKHLENEYNDRERCMKAAKEVESLTKKQYDLGYVDYFEVSDAQRLSLVNEREVISLKGSRFKALIQLIVASGGSL